MVLVIFILLSLFHYGQGIPTCSGYCNCSQLATGEPTASCRLNNLSELSKYIQRPEDVKILYLKITSTQKEDPGNLTADLSSLEELDITGNTNWTIPDEILKLPKLKEIRGAAIGTGCMKCTLMKDYQNDMLFASVHYIPDKGYKFQNVCIEQDITLHRKYHGFSRNRFFPKCLMDNKKCQNQLGMFTTRNRCIDIGSPMLLACICIGVTAIAANVVVLVVTLGTEKLRQKPTMMLICSLAFSDILVSSYVVSLGTVYQLITQENFHSQLNHVCSYLGFLAVSGFAFTAISSLLITIQRYLVIVYSLKPKLHLRTKSTLLCVAVETVIALFLGTWALLTPGVYQERETCIPVYGLETKPETAFGMTNMTICGLFYVCSFGLYAKIFTVAKNSGRNLGIRREVILMKRIGIIVATNFVLGFSPFVIVCVGISVVSHSKESYHDAWILLGIYVPLVCASLNALVDPFLYAYRNAQFIQTLMQKWKNIRPNRAPNRAQHASARKSPRDTRL